MINIYDLYLIATNGLCPYGIVCKNAVFIKHALALPLPEDEHYDIHVTWYIFFFLSVSSHSHALSVMKNFFFQ